MTTRRAMRIDRAARLSARCARVCASRQECHRSPARLVQVGLWSILRERPVIAHGEPVGLVGLPVHHQDVRMFMTHDFKAHSSPPPTSVYGRWAPALNKVLTVCAASRPRAAPSVQQKPASVRGLNQGGIANISCKETDRRAWAIAVFACKYCLTVAADIADRGRERS